MTLLISLIDLTENIAVDFDFLTATVPTPKNSFIEFNNNISLTCNSIEKIGRTRHSNLLWGSPIFLWNTKKLRFANAKRSHGFYSSNGGIKT